MCICDVGADSIATAEAGVVGGGGAKLALGGGQTIRVFRPSLLLNAQVVKKFTFVNRDAVENRRSVHVKECKCIIAPALPVLLIHYCVPRNPLTESTRT